MMNLRKCLGLLTLTWTVLGCGGHESPQQSVVHQSAGSLVEKIFSNHYFNDYKAGQCSDNILNFAEALKDAGESLDSYRIARIENKGSSVFGMVNAEAARGMAFNKPIIDEVNWYYHVVLVDLRSRKVFDFDYMINPTPVRLDTYIETMFLNEEECSKPKDYMTDFLCAGGPEKLENYAWEIVPAANAVTGDDGSYKFVTRMGDVQSSLR